MIKLQIIGNLGKDCTTNNVNGKNVINFSVAHTEKFTVNGEKREKTTWVEASYWTDKTGIAPYLKKGQQVFVEGQPEVKTYTTNDGKTGASLTLRVFSVQLLGGKQETQQQAAPAQQGFYAHNSATTEDYPQDDLPF